MTGRWPVASARCWCRVSPARSNPASATGPPGWSGSIWSEGGWAAREYGRSPRPDGRVRRRIARMGTAWCRHPGRHLVPPVQRSGEDGTHAGIAHRADGGARRRPLAMYMADTGLRQAGPALHRGRPHPPEGPVRRGTDRHDRGLGPRGGGTPRAGQDEAASRPDAADHRGRPVWERPHRAALADRALLPRIEDRHPGKCPAFDAITAFRVRDLSEPARARPDEPAGHHVAGEDIRALRVPASRHGFRIPGEPPEMTIAGSVVLTGGPAGFHPSKRRPLRAVPRSSRRRA